MINIKKYNLVELKDFPFDSEELTLKFISINNWRTLDQNRHGNDPVNHIYILRPMLNREDVDFIFLGWGGKVQEFNMMGWSQDVKNPSNPSIPIVFEFNFHLVRIASFYMYKIVFPLWLITIASMVTFAIDPRELQGRVDVLFTLLLSTIALLYVVQEQIPKISFLTIIDKIVNATLLHLALSVLFSYLVSIMPEPDRMNLILAVTNQVGYWIGNMVLLIPPYIRFRETIRGFVKKKIEIDENRRLSTSATGASSLLLIGDEDNKRDRRSVHVAMRRSFAVKYNRPSVLNMLKNAEECNGG